MTDPLVTVVVPIYNVEMYLERCVKSIVSQTYKNLEIILIDDGSSDSCPDICDRWAEKDDRIIVVHKENAGLGMARNTGIEIAKGKYIFFFDSDDYVDNSIVGKCVENAEKHNSDAVIYGRCDVYDDGRIEKKHMQVRQTCFYGESVKNIILPSMFTYDMGFGVSAWGKMFNLDTIRRNRLAFFSEREIISEDAYFVLGFFSHASVVTIIDESLYYYYKRTNSLSRVFRADRQQQNDSFLIKSIAFIREQKLSDNIEAHVKARYHMFCLSAMKQVVNSQLTNVEKKRELKKIFQSETLIASLGLDALSLHKKNTKLFFLLLKLRCFSFCEALLYIKIKQKIV